MLAGSRDKLQGSVEGIGILGIKWGRIFRKVVIEKKWQISTRCGGCQFSKISDLVRRPGLGKEQELIWLIQRYGSGTDNPLMIEGQGDLAK